MKETALGTLKDALGSKKFLAAASAGLAYVVVRIAGRYGVALDDATAAQIGDRLLALVGAYLGAQCVADHGKEAATIQARAAMFINTKEIPNG